MIMPRGSGQLLLPAKPWFIALTLLLALLADMLPLEGMLGCAAVDATTGLVLARELREDQPVDMDVIGAACAQILREHRQSSSAMGVGGPVEEIMTSTGARQMVTASSVAPERRHSSASCAKAIDAGSCWIRRRSSSRRGLSDTPLVYGATVTFSVF